MSKTSYRTRGSRREGSKSAHRSSPRRLGSRSANWRRFTLERLEERCVLSVDLWPALTYGELPDEEFFSAPADRMTLTSPAPSADLLEATAEAAAANFLPTAPFPLEDTFFLHSLPFATKTIYLDFDGHTTQNTAWNADYEFPTIVTPTFDTDGDPTSFSDAELLLIQGIWERVTEDFRPFNVNVTTQDPGVEALRQFGVNDNRWGIRVLIGGSTDDWYTPSTGDPEDRVGGIAFLNSFSWDSDTPTFVFAADYGGSEQGIATTISHEVGHTLGLGHHGLITFVENDEGELEREDEEYYGGHGTGPTSWGPIMGNASGREVSHWSQGNYPNATSLQDDLSIITSGLNGFTYRFDDHGNTRQTATPLGFSSTEFYGEGIVERNTDIDYFRFTIGDRGEAITFDIQPFARGPNLDILARVYNATGTVIATSNPIDRLDANFDLTLGAGTYYLSVEGGGRPATGASDFGYSDYSSLGYYKIDGTRKELLVGVDFDVAAGVIPTNWTRYAGPTPAVLTDLRNEAGFTTPFNLAINTGGAPIVRVPSTVNAPTVPDHVQPLMNVGGFITSQEWAFTWSDLAPSTIYEVFVLGHSNQERVNNVEIVGAGSPISFTQNLTANDLFINGVVGDSMLDLSVFAHTVLSTAAGTIEINVTPETGVAAIGGMAIRPAKAGSIHGQKWNDLNGDGIKDPDEPGLPGWVIYIDENDNGVLDNNIAVTVASDDVPQELLDHTTIKSELYFEGPRVIADVDVQLNITHTFNADLRAALISPAGTRVNLFTYVGGFNDNFQDTIFDDSAATPIANGSAPFAGSFRPQQPLSLFNGEDPNGIWTLEISDDANGNVGVLNSWSVSIRGNERFTQTDADGNYSFAELPPGEYIVREVEQAGWTQTFAAPPVVVTAGARVEDVDFGNWVPTVFPGSLAGNVWDDQDGDGAKGAGEPGLAGWTVYMDINGNGVFDPAAINVLVSDDVPKPIADFSTVISQVSFDGLGTIVDVELTFDVTHSFVADLDAYLISPSGTQVKLFSGVGGQFNNFQNTTLADDADTSITEGSAPFAGRYRPVGLLSTLQGQSPEGIWQLLIRDTAFGDTGTLNSWSLAITTREPSTVTDADGNYEFLDLAPGSYIIREVVQPGWQQTYPVMFTGNSFAAVVVESGEDIVEVDFGNRATGIVSGDYSGSGIVDAAAYTVWRDTLGMTVTPGTGADGSGNGVIDDNDFLVWKANFGAALPGVGTVIAEPAAVVSLAETSTADESEPAPVGLSAIESPSIVVQLELEARVSREAWLPRETGRHTSPSEAVAPRILQRIAATDSPRADALLAWLADSGRDGRRSDHTVALSGLTEHELAVNADHPASRDALQVAFSRLGAGDQRGISTWL